MKKGRMIIAVCLIVLIILYLAVRNQMVAKSPVDTDNAWNFGNLVKDLVRAYETPSEEDAETIAADLEKIRSVNEADIQGMVELLHLPKRSDPFAEDPAAATGG